MLKAKHKALKKAGAAFSQSENQSSTPLLSLLQSASPSLLLKPPSFGTLDVHCQVGMWRRLHSLIITLSRLVAACLLN